MSGTHRVDSTEGPTDDPGTRQETGVARRVASPGVMADPSSSKPNDPPTVPEATKPHGRGRPGRHTAAQRTVLILNIVVVIACFVGAGALLAAKEVRENFVAAPRATYDTTTSAATAASTSSIAAPGSDPASPTTAVDTTAPETFPDPDPQAMNFLITGSDNNACIDPDSPYAGAVENRESLGNRSDTIMVLRLDPTTNAAAILSFQRDLYVDIPGRAKGRINTTYQQGAYDLMAQTLLNNFGVKVDHFVQIDFCAFKRIVDAVGGVAVPFTYPVRDANTGLNVLEAGCHEFSGDEALAYVRSRHLQYQDTDGNWKSDGTSDYGRIARQQDFLRRMLQAASARGLLSPSVVRGLIEAVQQYVVFDQGFSTNDMLKFAGLLRSIPPESIHTYQVQATGKNVAGAAVLIPQIDGANMKAILDIFRGTAPLAGATEQVDDTTTSSATTSTSVAATTTTGVSSGLVTTTAPGATTSTTSTSTTSTTVATTPVVTNPEDITRGIVPDKTASC